MHMGMMMSPKSLHENIIVKTLFQVKSFHGPHQKIHRAHGRNWTPENQDYVFVEFH